MRVDVVTIFPEIIEAVMAHSLLGRASEQGFLSVRCTNPRDFTHDVHRTVDDAPYGGGAGMVMKADVVACAIERARQTNPNAPVVFLTPGGMPFTQQHARRFAADKGLILLCGHYEGIDERVIESHVDAEISLGDFVLTCGEIPALALLNGVTRLLPGTVGKEASLKAESFEIDLLDYPQYTRPATFRGWEVPSVLRSGNHQAIEKWRREQQEIRTRQRRPDLWEKWIN